MLCSSFFCTFLLLPLALLHQRLGPSALIGQLEAVVSSACTSVASEAPVKLVRFGPQPCCDLIVFRPVFGPPTFYDLAVYVPPKPTSTVAVDLPPSSTTSLSVVTQDCDHIHSHTPHPVYTWIGDKASAAADYLNGWSIEMSKITVGLDRVGSVLDRYSYIAMPAVWSLLSLLAILSILKMAIRIYRASTIGTPMVHPFDWAIGTSLVAYYHTIGLTIASAIHCAGLAILGLTFTIRAQSPPTPTLTPTPTQATIAVPVPETSGIGTDPPSPLSTGGVPGDTDGSLALDEAPILKMTEQERLKAILGPVVKVGGCRQRQKKRTKKCSSK